MRPVLRFLLAVFGLAMVASAPAHAQFTGQAKATLVDRLSVVKMQDLNFGTIMTNTTAGGTVTITTTGTRTSTGPIIVAPGPFSAAEFAGYGFRNQFVRISFGSPTTTITRVGGTETMTVSNFTTDPVVAGAGLQVVGQGNGNAPRYKIANANGLFNFFVGGRLTVNANQKAGTYVGQFSVNVVYQ